MNPKFFIALLFLLSFFKFYQHYYGKSKIEDPWDGESPWFCHGINCPMYHSAKNMSIAGQTVEIRVYETARWSSTKIPDTDLDDAEQKGFMRNFDYISGDNAAKEKIDMTSPVLNYVEPGQGPYCTTNFTVSFYAPYKYQPPHDPPPTPSDATVHLQTMEEMTVAVLSYPGRPSQMKADAKAEQLNLLLAQSGLKYDKDNWFVAGYDPPFRPTHLHSEIWIRLTDNPLSDDNAWIDNI